MEGEKRRPVIMNKNEKRRMIRANPFRSVDAF
jgi:hypothetical protein